MDLAEDVSAAGKAWGRVDCGGGFGRRMSGLGGGSLLSAIVVSRRDVTESQDVNLNVQIDCGFFAPD